MDCCKIDIGGQLPATLQRPNHARLLGAMSCPAGPQQKTEAKKPSLYILYTCAHMAWPIQKSLSNTALKVTHQKVHSVEQYTNRTPSMSFRTHRSCNILQRYLLLTCRAMFHQREVIRKKTTYFFGYRMSFGRQIWWAFRKPRLSYHS